MKTNFVLVGLSYNISKMLADKLSTSLDMFYLDINDLISYNFSNKNEVISKVGVDYYDNQVTKLVVGASSYENTIINCPYDLILNSNISTALKNTCTLVFIKVSEEELIKQNNNLSNDKKIDLTLIAYDELCKLLQEICDITFDYNDEDLDNCINKLMKKLKTEC